MKPAPFEYHAPSDIDEALHLLAQYGNEAKILAGGQSLVPAMNLRLSRPHVLIDINRIEALGYIRRESTTLRVGALARHRDLEMMTGQDGLTMFLSRVASLVAHPPIRMRGTMAGSLSFADPAAEWCAAAMLLDAHVVVASAQGRRTVEVGDLIAAPFRTSLEPDEMVLEVRIPVPDAGHGVIVEHSHTSGDFAVVVAAAYAEVDVGRRRLRVVVGGASPTPLRLRPLEEGLGSRHIPDVQEVESLVGPNLDPSSDNYGSARYRRHLACVLAQRALAEAMR